MKKILLLAAVLMTSVAFAQDLPRKSSMGSVSQKVGLNTIEINYSRPSANNRVLFGDVVPYGEVWRLGANEPTTITLSEPIFIDGKKVEAGEYAVFAIPSKNYWTVVFNTDTKQWGSSAYDPAKNVVEYTAAVNQGAHTETFCISFDNVTADAAVLSFSWGTTNVKVPFTTETGKAVEASIQQAIDKGENLARVYYNAADYMHENGEKERAQEYLDKSLKIERSYYNVFLKAQHVADAGDKAKAVKLGTEAAEMAKKADKKGWADYILRNVNDWK